MSHEDFFLLLLFSGSNGVSFICIRRVTVYLRTARRTEGDVERRQIIFFLLPWIARSLASRSWMLNECLLYLMDFVWEFSRQTTKEVDILFQFSFFFGGNKMFSRISISESSGFRVLGEDPMLCSTSSSNFDPKFRRRRRRKKFFWFRSGGIFWSHRKGYEGASSKLFMDHEILFLFSVFMLFSSFSQSLQILISASFALRQK